MKTKMLMTVSIPIELRKLLVDRAEKENRNLSNMVTFLLEKELKGKEKAA
jgi:hypothetical protein